MTMSGTELKNLWNENYYIFKSHPNNIKGYIYTMHRSPYVKIHKRGLDMINIIDYGR